MAIASKFPAAIEFDGAIWHLLHDPSNPNSVRPNVTERDVQGVSADPVKIPGNQKQLWLVTVSILIPSQMVDNKIIGARRMVGFRLNEYQPLPSDRVRPEDLVYYIAEQSDGSAAQRFINAILGAPVHQPEDEKPDTSWCKQMFTEQPPAQAAHPAPQAITRTPSEAPHDNGK